MEGWGPQLLRGKEWHDGWRRQGHIHQPHRRPVRAHHQHLGPTVRRGEGYDDIVQSVYEWSTGVFNLSSSSTINHRITDEDRGAWSAFEAARAGALWIEDQTGFEMNEVTINWPSGTWPSSSGTVIDIPAEDGHIWDQGTILHEYGHCIHYTVRGGSFPYTEGLDPHYVDSVSNGPFALTEGWAEFFERAVMGDPVRSDGSNMESTVYADGPFFNGDYGDWDGNIGGGRRGQCPLGHL